MAPRIWRKTAAIGGVVLGVLGAGLLLIRKPSGAPQRVALVGDSYAAGLGPEIVKLIADFRFEGRIGSGTYSWLRLPEWLKDFRPQVVLVSLGVNDGTTPNPLNYRRIVEAIDALGARTVWIEPPAGVHVPATRAIVAGLGVLTVPATATPLSADGLHPVSYRPWAAEVVRALSRAAV